jgi:hypothetical protein
MKALVVSAALFLASGVLRPQGSDSTTFEERSRRIISYYDTSSGRGYGQVTARYGMNHRTREADSILIDLLKNPRGDMFWMYVVMGAYLHGKDRMSPEAKAAVRSSWKTYPPYRGDTENHWCLYYTSLLLAAQEWPHLPGSEWYNGKSSDENYAEAKDYLIHWIRVTTTIGQGEFDSPDYFHIYVISMTLLSEFAQEPEMQQRGTMMLDYLFADFAAEHLAGQYTGGFSRIYQPAVYRPYEANASPLAYLYFGQGDRRISEYALLPALSPYRLPGIIQNIATDRAAPYVHRERKRVRNVIRYGSERNPPVYKYTYMTKDYSLGSLQGGLLQPIQQHTWGVQCMAGKPTTAVFGLHPYWSGFELGMFFPEEAKHLIGDVITSKSTYNNPDKWTGGSPFERTFQHKGTLLVLYDIAAGTTSDHIDGFFPKNLDERLVDSSGWIISRAGDTYIGWYPLQEYVWKEEGECFRLRSTKLQNGCILEVRSRDQVGSFGNFQEKLTSHIPKSVLAPGAVSVEYRTIDGDVMKFSFPEGRKLNGAAVDLSRTQLFEGPFVNARVGSEKLTMTYRHTRLILDFRKLTITQ